MYMQNKLSSKKNSKLFGSISASIRQCDTESHPPHHQKQGVRLKAHRSEIATLPIFFAFASNRDHEGTRVM